MIRKSLANKLILSYLAVALLTILVVTLVIRLNSGQQFFNLVMEQQAALLNDEAAYYYLSTGSWNGFFEYYHSSFRDVPPSGGVQPFDQSPAQSESPPHGAFPREIRGRHGLVDLDYRAIIPFAGANIGDVVPAAYRKNLIPVEVNGETVAWIIPDTRFQFQLSAEEQIFLQRTNRAILLAGLAGVFGAVLMGVLLARGLLRPVRSLMDASLKMAAGDLEQRVPVQSHDELGQLSQTFNQMSADLARSDQQRRQLTADVTHDLSTPLQVIAGYVEMLEDDPGMLTPARVETIKHEIDLLRRLVSDMSLLATADAKELQLDLEPVSAIELLTSVAGRYEALAGKDDKRIEVSTDPNSPVLLVDPSRMAQVLGNLVDNAIRYTPAGGVVRLNACDKDGQVELRVQDEGPGIHPDDLPYVFNRFYRAGKARSGNPGKMGLGLAIARALVQAQGGQIHIETEGDGRGTAFVITFPTV